MIDVVTADEMRERDRYTIETVGLSAHVLMERAAMAVSSVVMKEADTIAGDPASVRIICVCGSGNNGGDGAACARILAGCHYSAGILFAGREENLSGAASDQLRSARMTGVPFVGEDALETADIIVDALLGTGLSGPVKGSKAAVIGKINARKGSARIVSIDVASGTDADTGRCLAADPETGEEREEAVKADVTVAIQFPKAGQLLFPGAAYAGEIVVGNAGIEQDGRPPFAHLLEEEDVRLAVPERKQEGNKGTFGKVLVAAGSEGMCGAAYLCAKAVLRAGAGMVRVVTAEGNVHVLTEMLPEAMTASYTDPDSAADAVRRFSDWADVFVVGPGTGRGETGLALAETVLAVHGEKPVVMDADAFAFPQLLNGCEADRKCVILTPHVGEMRMLSGLSAEEILSDLPGTAMREAARTGAIVHLKDAHSVTAGPDGRLFFTVNGSAALSTAGSGDCLTGIMAALLARGCPPSMAAPCGAYIHGLCGEYAARVHGESGVLAGDIADAAGPVLEELGR